MRTVDDTVELMQWWLTQAGLSVQAPYAHTRGHADGGGNRRQGISLIEAARLGATPHGIVHEGLHRRCGARHDHSAAVHRLRPKRRPLPSPNPRPQTHKLPCGSTVPDFAESSLTAQQRGLKRRDTGRSSCIVIG